MSWWSCQRAVVRWAITVVVSKELVEVNFCLYVIALRVPEPGPENMAVINTDVAGGSVKVGHLVDVCCWKR
jgi:hypothetical protein